MRERRQSAFEQKITTAKTLILGRRKCPEMEEIPCATLDEPPKRRL